MPGTPAIASSASAARRSSSAASGPCRLACTGLPRPDRGRRPEVGHGDARDPCEALAHRLAHLGDRHRAPVALRQAGEQRRVVLARGGAGVDRDVGVPDARELADRGLGLAQLLLGELERGPDRRVHLHEHLVVVGLRNEFGADQLDQREGAEERDQREHHRGRAVLQAPAQQRARSRSPGAASRPGSRAGPGRAGRGRAARARPGRATPRTASGPA